MGKINVKTNKGPGSTTENLAGGEAFLLTEKQKFVSGITTSFFDEEKYYGDNTQQVVDSIVDMISKDPQFVAKSAIYCRNVLNLRTMPTVMVGLLGLDPVGRQLVRNTINSVLTRPDQLCELVAFYNAIDPSGKLAKRIRQVLLGIQDRFLTFDEYQLAKYKGGSGQIKLKDVFRLAHPSPKNQEQYDLFNRLLTNNLKTPETWEVELSKGGDRKSAWEKLIAEGNLGYMALLRNLRNILEAGVSYESISKVCSDISHKQRVLKSKQLPFRFISAYKVVESVPSPHSSMVLTALSAAIRHSIPESFGGSTFCASDNSGSMSGRLSRKSSLSYRDVATTLSAIIADISPMNIVGVFGHLYKTVNLDTSSSILENSRKLEKTHVGHSTNGYLAIKYLIDNDIVVDRIVLVSDLQLYGGSINTEFSIYVKDVNPDVWLHLIDLSGYGTTPVQITGNVNLISGWSEKILKFIPMVENGTGGMIKEIEGIQL